MKTNSNCVWWMFVVGGIDEFLVWANGHFKNVLKRLIIVQFSVMLTTNMYINLNGNSFNTPDTSSVQ